LGILFLKDLFLLLVHYFTILGESDTGKNGTCKNGTVKLTQVIMTNGKVGKNGTS